MDQPIPRILAAVLATVLLCLAVTVVTQLFHQVSLQASIDDAAHKLDVLQQRLQKQQAEYDEALSALPAVQALAEAALPEAQAAYDQEQALRAQRKALRAENAELADTIASLHSQADAANRLAADAQVAIDHLESALGTLYDALYHIRE